jgi:hypothetical protein
MSFTRCIWPLALILVCATQAEAKPTTGKSDLVYFPIGWGPTALSENRLRDVELMSEHLDVDVYPTFIRVQATYELRAGEDGREGFWLGFLESWPSTVDQDLVEKCNLRVECPIHCSHLWDDVQEVDTRHRALPFDKALFDELYAEQGVGQPQQPASANAQEAPKRKPPDFYGRLCSELDESGEFPESARQCCDANADLECEVHTPYDVDYDNVDTLVFRDPFSARQNHRYDGPGLSGLKAWLEGTPLKVRRHVASTSCGGRRHYFESHWQALRLHLPAGRKVQLKVQYYQALPGVQPEERVNDRNLLTPGRCTGGRVSRTDVLEGRLQQAPFWFIHQTLNGVGNPQDWAPADDGPAVTIRMHGWKNQLLCCNSEGTEQDAAGSLLFDWKDTSAPHVLRCIRHGTPPNYKTAGWPAPEKLDAGVPDDIVFYDQVVRFLVRQRSQPDAGNESKIVKRHHRFIHLLRDAGFSKDDTTAYTARQILKLIRNQMREEMEGNPLIPKPTPRRRLLTWLWPYHASVEYFQADRATPFGTPPRLFHLPQLELAHVVAAHQYVPPRQRKPSWIPAVVLLGLAVFVIALMLWVFRAPR